MSTYFRSFASTFALLTGYSPMRWQSRLFDQFTTGRIPIALDLPTGLGKTSVIAIWLIARAHGAAISRRLVYVVDRRAVVDQATEEAEKLRNALEGKAPHFDSLNEISRAEAKRLAADLKKRLGFDNDREIVPPFKLLSLSATGRARPMSDNGIQEGTFRLEGEDLADPVVEKRLIAKKVLSFVKIDDEKDALVEALAQQAWKRSGEAIVK